MRSDPTGNMNPDRRDLPALGPNPSSARLAPRHDPEPRERIDNHLLQSPHIGMHIALPFSQIENRITHNLPRPMISNIAPAISLIKIDARPRQQLRPSEQILRMPIPPHSDHMRMLDKNQLIRTRPALPQLDSFLLLEQRVSPPQKPQVPHSHTSTETIHNSYQAVTAGSGVQLLTQRRKARQDFFCVPLRALRLCVKTVFRH